jgi:hypothetical protein
MLTFFDEYTSLVTYQRAAPSINRNHVFDAISLVLDY